MAERTRFSLVLAGEFDCDRKTAIERAEAAFKSLGATEGRFTTYENQFSPNGTDLREEVPEEAPVLAVARRPAKPRAVKQPVKKAAKKAPAKKAVKKRR